MAMVMATVMGTELKMNWYSKPKRSVGIPTSMEMSSCAVVFIFCSTIFSSCFASDWTAQVGAGVSQSDNFSRVEANPDSQTSTDASIAINGTQKGARYDASMASNLAYVRRTGGTSSEVQGALIGSLEYKPITDRLSVSINDTFGQYLDSTNQPVQVVDNPNNRHAYNILSVGPDLQIPISNRVKFSYNSRWIKSLYEHSPYDSDRLQMDARMYYALSSYSSIYVGLTNGKIEFDGYTDPQSSYRITETSAGFSTKSSKGEFNVSLGKTSLKHDHSNGDPSSLMRASIAQNLNKTMRLLFNAGVTYEDPSSGFVLNQGLYGVNSGALAQPFSNDAYKYHYADVGLSLNSAKMTMLGTVNYNRTFYDSQTQLNSNHRSLRVYIARQVSQKLGINLNAELGKRTFVVNDSGYTDWSAGWGLVWHFNAKLAANFGYAHYEGLQNQNSVSSQPYSYKENRANLRLVYSIIR